MCFTDKVGSRKAAWLGAASRVAREETCKPQPKKRSYVLPGHIRFKTREHEVFFFFWLSVCLKFSLPLENDADGVFGGKWKKPERRSSKSAMISGDEEAKDTFHPITLCV